MNPAQGNAPDYAMLLSRFSSSGQWDHVLDTAREWLSINPENPSAHFAAGQALINLHRHAEAEPHIQRVLIASPQNSLAHHYLSVIHFDQKRYDQANESIHQAISLRPNDAMHWYQLAWMFYRHGDAASARKYAEKARTLSPRDAAILNLIGLCSPVDRPLENAQKLEHYRQALELDPEDAAIHNNLGIYYLDSLKDYRTAEACFRRALFFDPTLKVARSNLLIALKGTDPLYRCLCAPKDFLLRIWSMIRRVFRTNILLYLILIPIWLVAIRFVLGGLLLWCIFVWPLVKVYEFLTVGDLRGQAGEIGARRGGFLGYRRWSPRVRVAIFTAVLLLFWGTLVGLYANENTRPIFWQITAVAAVAVVVRLLILVSRSGHRWTQGRDRAEALASRMEPPKKRRSWNFFRRSPNASGAKTPAASQFPESQ